MANLRVDFCKLMKYSLMNVKTKEKNDLVRPSIKHCGFAFTRLTLREAISPKKIY